MADNRETFARGSTVPDLDMTRCMHVQLEAFGEFL
jgi:hypothetical protein